MSTCSSGAPHVHLITTVLSGLKLRHFLCQAQFESSFQSQWIDCVLASKKQQWSYWLSAGGESDGALSYEIPKATTLIRLCTKAELIGQGPA